MDFTKAITYNGLSINTVTSSAGGRPLSGYQVDGIDWLGVSARAYMEDRALADGANAGDVYLRAQPFQLIVSVFGSTAGDFWDKVQDLRAAFNPVVAYNADSDSLGFLPLAYYRPTADIASWPTSAYPNGIPVELDVRATGQIGTSLRRDNTGGTSGRGAAQRFVIPLVAKTPLAIGQAVRSVALSVSSTTAAQSATLALYGDYQSWPYFRLFAATGTYTFNVRYGSVTYQFTNLPMTLATYLWLEPETRRAYRSLTRATPFAPYGDGANMVKYLTVTGSWQPLPAAGGTLTIQSSSATDVIVATAYARDTWA